jgi:arsenate reductase
MSAADVVVYEKRTCTTCRQVADLLRSQGIAYEDVQYHVEGITQETIRELLAKAGISARDALRMREEGAPELAGGGSEDEIVAEIPDKDAGGGGGMPDMSGMM